MYHGYFLKRLKARLRRKASLFPGEFELSRLSGIRTLREFDEVYTAPDGGYQNADDYYDRAGARHVLAGIEVPTLIITAQDDPFIPYSMVNTQAIMSNSWIWLWALSSPALRRLCCQPGSAGINRFQSATVSARMPGSSSMISTAAVVCLMKTVTTPALSPVPARAFCTRVVMFSTCVLPFISSRSGMLFTVMRLSPTPCP